MMTAAAMMRTTAAMTKRLLPLAIGLALCGFDRPSVDYRPAPPPPPPPPAANGAIFQANAGYVPLTSGTRAGAVGDLITIRLVERTQGTVSNSTDTSHDGSIGLTPPTTGPLSVFTSSDVGAGGESTFSGQGASEQSNALSGEITVTVVEVYANGTMLVRGEKQLRINRGNEFVRVSGIVRQADITADNRVPSTRVADARIDYIGRGEVARAGRQGWLQRFFSRITPF